MFSVVYTVTKNVKKNVTKPRDDIATPETTTKSNPEIQMLSKDEKTIFIIKNFMVLGLDKSYFDFLQFLHLDRDNEEISIRYIDILFKSSEIPSLDKIKRDYDYEVQEAKEILKRNNSYDFSSIGEDSFW